ncbi:MAG TPA: hypothetical protein VKU41_16940 [Polyangiaceae bacterium]|nr:hypothetical protein [Polyangiaceae bacterium]
MLRKSWLFPPFPTGLKGRRTELAVLGRLLSSASSSRVALVGPGGSGKSVLACALGHRVGSRYPGGRHWFRSGPWDVATLGEMLAVRFGTSRARGRRFASLRAFFRARGPTLVVLDNHENDRAVASLLDAMKDAPVDWVITARRCLLAGVYVFPVVAPLATTGVGPFRRVVALTRLLRHNPLALDIADGLVRSAAVTVRALQRWLVDEGVDRVRVVAHEDDLPEVALLVGWAWRRLGVDERRILAVLAHSGGDHVDASSLGVLARVPAPSLRRALSRLRAWRLVQCPFTDRYALHAVVRHALVGRTRFSPRRLLRHYLSMLEGAPERLDLEQTHLYAAMDHAHATSDLGAMLRIDALLARLQQ